MTNQAQTRVATIAAIRAELKARGLVPVHRRSDALADRMLEKLIERLTKAHSH